MPLALSRPRAPSRGAPAADLPPVLETDLDRILKLVPSEVLLLYTALAPQVTDMTWPHLGLVLVGAGALLVPVILYLDGWSTGEPAPWLQYVVRTLAFVACALAIAWPFDPGVARELDWLRSLSVLAVPFLGAVLLRERRPEGPA